MGYRSLGRKEPGVTERRGNSKGAGLSTTLLVCNLPFGLCVGGMVCAPLQPENISKR